MIKQLLLIVASLMITITEQRPSIYQNESVLQSTRHIQNIQSTQKDNKTTPVTTEVSNTERTDFYTIFIKSLTSADKEKVEKRSMDAVNAEDAGDTQKNDEDLDTAANMVFRPLFAYRQQNERRRRLRNLRYYNH